MKGTLIQGGYFMADQSKLRPNSLFMDNSGLFKYRVLLDIVLRLIMSNLNALAIKLWSWLIEMYEKMEAKNHLNRRTSNQLEFAIIF